MEALVGILGRTQPGKHAHGPETAPVHGRLNAPGVGIGTGITQILFIIHFGHVRRGIDIFYLQVGDGRKSFFSFRMNGKTVRKVLFPRLPCPFGPFQSGRL